MIKPWPLIERRCHTVLYVTWDGEIVEASVKLTQESIQIIQHLPDYVVQPLHDVIKSGIPRAFNYHLPIHDIRKNIQHLPDQAVNDLRAIIRSGIPQTFRYRLPINGIPIHRIARCFPLVNEPNDDNWIAAVIQQYICAGHQI